MADLEPRFNLKVNGEDREVFMSFGLLNELASWIRAPEAIPGASIDPEMRREILGRLLAERKPSGKMITAVEDVEDLELEVEEVHELLEWALGHVLGFFIRSMKTVQKVVEKDETTAKALASTLTGSKV